MTGPDRIWIDRHGGNWSPVDGGTQDVDYIRRDPAVLAALPEVQALIAAAYEVAATCTEWTAWGQRHNLTEASRRAIRALTPADATAALAARDAAMRAEGLREVQALIAAAYEVAAGVAADRAAACGVREISSLIKAHVLRSAPADATAALARIVREAEARGMERAADRARVYASNYEQSSDGRNTFILLAEWADAEAAAILARAAEIEGDGK